jgi:hypothetical protein
MAHPARSTPSSEGGAAVTASKFFVASKLMRDLLLCAKHLLVAAMITLLGDNLMLGKLSIMGAVAILMIPHSAVRANGWWH